MRFPWQKKDPAGEFLTAHADYVRRSDQTRRLLTARANLVIAALYQSLVRLGSELGSNDPAEAAPERE